MPCSSPPSKPIERDERGFDREQERSERKELDDLERALDDLAERARDLARDALSAAGYHQHHRGEWRKRRVSRHREERSSAERMMDNWAVGELIDWAAGKDGNTKTKATLRDELCDFAAELAGPSPSPVERVLAETAATSLVRLPDARSPLRGWRDVGRGDDARPIRARSASHGSSPPPIPEHPEDPRQPCAGSPFRPCKSTSPRQQVNQLNAGGSS